MNEPAMEALREIVMMCGYGDPSDGEGTSPQEVVAIVQSQLSTANAEIERLNAQDFKPLFEEAMTAGLKLKENNRQLAAQVVELEAQLQMKCSELQLANNPEPEVLRLEARVAELEKELTAALAIIEKIGFYCVGEKEMNANQCTAIANTCHQYLDSAKQSTKQ